MTVLVTDLMRILNVAVMSVIIYSAALTSSRQSNVTYVPTKIVHGRAVFHRFITGRRTASCNFMLKNDMLCEIQKAAVVRKQKANHINRFKTRKTP